VLSSLYEHYNKYILKSQWTTPQQSASLHAATQDVRGCHSSCQNKNFCHGCLYWILSAWPKLSCNSIISKWIWQTPFSSIVIVACISAENSKCAQADRVNTHTHTHIWQQYSPSNDGSETPIHKALHTLCRDSYWTHSPSHTLHTSLYC